MAPVELPETHTVGVAGGPHELPDPRKPAELEAPTTETVRAPRGKKHDTIGDRQRNR